LVIPPYKTQNTFGTHICKPAIHPWRQKYKKQEEGVYRSEYVPIRGLGLDKFMAKNYLASLNKSGFGSLGPTDQNWKGIFNLFDEVEKGNGLTPNKRIPEYSTWSTRMLRYLRKEIVLGEFLCFIFLLLYNMTNFLLILLFSQESSKS
jgi:hypothetical protein